MTDRGISQPLRRTNSILLTGVSASRLIHIATYRNIVFIASVCHTGQPACIAEHVHEVGRFSSSIGRQVPRLSESFGWNKLDASYLGKMNTRGAKTVRDGTSSVLLGSECTKRVFH